MVTVTAAPVRVVYERSTGYPVHRTDLPLAAPLMAGFSAVFSVGGGHESWGPEVEDEAAQGGDRGYDGGRKIR